MELNDILALARAGFTADQIAALSQQPPAPAPIPAPAPAPAAVQQAPAAAPAPAPAAEPTERDAYILKAITALRQDMAARSINASQQPAVQSADDILAAIIAPPRKEN